MESTALDCAAWQARSGVSNTSRRRTRAGGRDVRAFYGDVLGLVEKPVPDSLVDQELVWFEAGRPTSSFISCPIRCRRTSAQRHFCLEVGDLDGWRRKLEGAGVETSDDTPIPNRPRFFCRDPFGNLIELTTILGDYRT